MDYLHHHIAANSISHVKKLIKHTRFNSKIDFAILLFVEMVSVSFTSLSRKVGETVNTEPHLIFICVLARQEPEMTSFPDRK